MAANKPDENRSKLEDLAVISKSLSRVAWLDEIWNHEYPICPKKGMLLARKIFKIHNYYAKIPFMVKNGKYFVTLGFFINISFLMSQKYRVKW